MNKKFLKVALITATLIAAGCGDSPRKTLLQVKKTP